MDLISLVATVFTAAKFSYGLVTGRKELDTESLNLRQVQKLYERCGRITTSVTLEDMQEKTNARLPDLKRLIKALKKSSETPIFFSSSTEWPMMPPSSASECWSILNITTCEETWNWNKWRQRIWLDVVEDPSPPVLLVKWFSVAMLGLAIYHSHLGDCYQNYFLVAGLASAVIIADGFSQSMMSGIQTFLPFCVILTLCWSAVIHRLARAVSRNQTRQKE